MGILLSSVKNQSANEIICLVLIFIFTYFMSAFTGNLSGFAAVCGPQSMVLYTVGLALAGFLSNVISILFVFLFPTSDKNLEKQNLILQLISYLILLGVLFVSYVIISLRFFKNHGHFINSFDSAKTVNKKIVKDDKILKNEDSKSDKLLESNDSIEIESKPTWKTNLSEPIYNFWGVLKRMIDLYLGILFNYFFTLEIVCYMIPTLTNKYDNENQYYLLMYLFLYNLGDTIGRMIPNKYFLSSSSKLHLLNFLRGLLQIYFVIVVLKDPPVSVTHWAIRGILYLFTGVSNGYFTNNFFLFSTNRFGISVNKDLAGFLIIFGLVVGVATGTFSGVLWNIN
jgi:hypothetical protein